MSKNIIYFNSGAIGDFLMTLFFMENVKENFSSEHKINYFVVVAKNKHVLRSLCKEYSHINIIELNRKNVFLIISFVLRFILKRNYVITQPTGGKIPLSIKITAKLISLNQGSLLIGFDDGSKINKYIYKKMLQFNPNIPFFESLKFLARKMGFEAVKEIPDFKYKKMDGIFRKYNLIPQRYIVLHPFANYSFKNLPTERWVDIAEYLVLNYQDLKLVITGSNSERKIGEEIISKITPKDNVLNLSGFLSMQELANVIDGAKLYIGVDSGITHLAGVLQKKSLVIGSYLYPSYLQYYNKNAIILYNISQCHCAPCHKNPCLEECKKSYLKCMIDISQDLIKSELKNMLP